MDIRTSIGGVAQHPDNGKWNITFETFMGRPDHFQRPSSILTTPAKFETEAEAYAAANRALDILEQTGMFPNFSEQF